MASISRLIDHTLLRPDAIPAEVEKLCVEAREHSFCTVCINPCYVPLASRVLRGSGVGVCTVIGFPLGASSSRTKAFEADAAVKEGAAELDMVLTIGLLKAGENEQVREGIEEVVEASWGRAVKVIIETCLLTNEEKERAARIVVDAGAAFVKTSTGFSTGGATVEDVALLRRVVGPDFGVKAAGGIRDLLTARKMVEAGATRIGTSSGVKIAAEESKQQTVDCIQGKK